MIVKVTVCAKNRRPILANDDGHQAFIDAWEKADSWIVGRYVILPDHLHLFAAPASIDSPGVKRWVAYWKSEISRNWPNPTAPRPLLQRDCWDRQLRTSESYREKWAYVRRNPVRHGHVDHPDQWPYQGEIHPLIWSDP